MSKSKQYVFHASRNQIIFEKALNKAGFQVKQQLIWNKHHIKSNFQITSQSSVQPQTFILKLNLTTPCDINTSQNSWVKFNY